MLTWGGSHVVSRPTRRLALLLALGLAALARPGCADHWPDLLRLADAGSGPTRPSTS